MAGAAAKAATGFERNFRPEFLLSRRDVTKTMLAAASGNFEEVCKCLKENEGELNVPNKDGNSLLLLAAANQHVELTEKLLELKANAYHQNAAKMDVLDYAKMQSLWSPMSKMVLSHFDFVMPEIMDGPYRKRAAANFEKLKGNGILLARSSILGPTPDFSDMLAKETDYRVEWLRSLRRIVKTVKTGLLLLDSDIGYLQRDALLTGALEVPAAQRYVYFSEERSIMRFSTALKTFYKEKMQQRMMEACTVGDGTSVQGLLKAHAQPDTQDSFGQTALMRAAHTGDPVCVNSLLQAKACANTQTKDGYPALFLAAVDGHERAVRILLTHKADLNIRSFKARSVADFIKHQGNQSILHILNEEREMLQEETRKNPEIARSSGLWNLLR